MKQCVEYWADCMLYGQPYFVYHACYCMACFVCCVVLCFVCCTCFYLALCYYVCKHLEDFYLSMTPWGGGRKLFPDFTYVIYGFWSMIAGPEIHASPRKKSQTVKVEISGV